MEGDSNVTWCAVTPVVARVRCPRGHDRGGGCRPVHGQRCRNADDVNLSLALAQIATQIESATTSKCTTPALTEPFTAFGDTNQYALLPGESADSFTGTGWTLFGGAKLTSVKLYDGTSGQVLDLPVGGVAVSPATCVTNAYTTFRTIGHSLSGSATLGVDESLASSVPSLTSLGSLTFSGTTWTSTPDLNLTSISSTAWQDAWSTFADSGNEAQLYDLYADPRMKG